MGKERRKKGGGGGVEMWGGGRRRARVTTTVGGGLKSGSGARRGREVVPGIKACQEGFWPVGIPLASELLHYKEQGRCKRRIV